MNFKVGDRVRAIEAYDGKKEIVGKIGTIKHINNNFSFLVEFDENIKGHDGDGTLKRGHCWNCAKYVLEPVYREIKVGEKYRVTHSHKENGNTIEVYKIECDVAYYKTLVGVNHSQNFFFIGSDFHKGLIPYTDEKIVITTDGKTTTAKMYEGKKVVKEAKAVCSPDDEFNFNIGATIALERLTGYVHGQLESTLEETWYNGKVVCVDNVLNETLYTSGKIYEFKNGYMMNNDNINTRFHNFKEFTSFTGSKFIEVVE
jgi:hypothetical protein